jgi:acyl-CoA reductase-like NAD-dependent aldehyde dehydrogenase
MIEFTMTMGGCAVRGESFYPVVNPATGAPFAEAPECTTQRIYPMLAAAIAETARRTGVGDGFEPGSEIGPLNNRMQFERIASLVEDAKRTGARMVTGGGPRSGPGYFFEPTIVTDIDDGARLVAEEQFGPALPILPYRDVGDALARANATHYGLGHELGALGLEGYTQPQVVRAAKG